MTERLVHNPMDRYVVLEHLAEGGMGAIYLGKKIGAGGFEKEVVLKQLLPEYTLQPEFIELFLREARLAATLDHANIVHTMDLVRAGDDYFMVMEHVRGGDLRTLFKRSKRRRRRFIPAAGIYVARETLSALAYAHGKRGLDGRPIGLIHRDVSPSNILVSGNGEVKLTDFGIAKATTHRSIFYRVKGKVGYMSPEQARGDPLLPRSDLYSVGVTLYEMLTGERLHVPQSITTSADELYSHPIPAVSEKVPGLPAELDTIVWKALAVEPDFRYQTAVDFQEALIAVANQHRLAFSAPELARHLVDVCGPVAEWRTTVISESLPSGTEVYENEKQQQRALTDPDLEAFLAAAEAERDAIEEDLVWVNELGAGKTTGPQPLARTRRETTRDTQRLGAVDTTSVLSSQVIPAAPVVKRRIWPRRAAAIAVMAGAVVAAVLVVRANAPPPPAPRPAAAPAPPKPPPPIKLAVESDPPGARVLLDGQPRCMAPCTLERPGGQAARLRLEKEGYLPWTALVVGPDAAPQKAKLRPRAPASWGAVRLTTSIAANVAIGGKPIGYATGGDEPLWLPPGDVTLDLVPPGGGKPVSVPVTVKSGAVAEIAVTSP
ncbi:MAG TPA: serine/threonine-protein kinase [Haliangiales bacterium]|nr:serine/threonine-protein kinase [Haliangiales bacterium]